MSQSGGAQFTPGPWVGYTNTDEGRHIISEAYAQDVIVCEQVHTDADISIIAAAPAMYEALKTLHGVLDQRMSDGRTLNQHLGKELFECFYGPAIAARAAIAKAEGG